MMGHRKRRAAGAFGALATIAALGACATLPPSGYVHVGRLQGASGPAQPGVVQFVAVGPAPTWLPQDVVHGFLIASADFTNRSAVAREYLSPAYRSTWNPGWAATVVDASPTFNLVLPPPHVNAGSGNTAIVNMTSQHVATLSTAGKFQAGQYLVFSRPQVFQFGLVRTGDGAWLIDKLPSPALLLLTKPDFLRDYEPRNLYFMPANSSADVLVPDPVFIPQQLDTQDVVKGLVKGLLWQSNRSSQPGPPVGWLQGAATTAFPRGTTLIGTPQVTGSQVTVDLGGNAAKASPTQWRQMAAQLFWSLTSSSYGTPTAIRSLVIQLNHKDWHPVGGQPLRLFKDYQAWVPAVPTAPVYFQAADSTAAPAIRVLPPDGSGSQLVPLPSGFGQGPFGAFAVQPGPASSAILAGCRGKNVYTSRLQHGTTVAMQTLPASCTSLGWDTRGDLWVMTRTGPFILPPSKAGGGVRQILPVSAPPALLPPDVVTSLRVAPDGVRVAMIVSTKAGAKVMVAAISQHAGTAYLAPSTQTATVGSDILGSPIALSWWDADHLLVLAQPKGAAAQLYEVPLNGGISAPVVTPAAAISVAVSGSAVLVGTASQRGSPLGPMWRMSGLNGSWRPVTEGSSPVTPG